MSDKNGKETYQQKQSREAFEGYLRRGLTYDYLYEEYIVKNRSLQSLTDDFEKSLIILH